MTTPFKVLGPLFLSKIDISNTPMKATICHKCWELIGLDLTELNPT